MSTARDRWQQAFEDAKVRDADFSTMSGIPVAPVYGPDDGEFPGEWPYTRGPYASMYRSKLWTMRMLAGVEDLYRDIDLSKVTTSMTINSPAAILLAMYVAAAERSGASRRDLGGTLQNDILKEYQAQKEYVFPPRPSMRIVSDTLRFCTAEMPRWHPISVSGYHIREAGSTAAQELAFTLANGFAYIEAGMAAGLDVDEFAPRLSFFFNAHIDFFEEIAKYRAARRIWARWIADRYGAEAERSRQLRFHTQTA